MLFQHRQPWSRSKKQKAKDHGALCSPVQISETSRQTNGRCSLRMRLRMTDLPIMKYSYNQAKTFIKSKYVCFSFNIRHNAYYNFMQFLNLSKIHKIPMLFKKGYGSNVYISMYFAATKLNKLAIRVNFNYVTVLHPNIFLIRFLLFFADESHN